MEHVHRPTSLKETEAGGQLRAGRPRLLNHSLLARHPQVCARAGRWPCAAAGVCGNKVLGRNMEAWHTTCAPRRAAIAACNLDRMYNNRSFCRRYHNVLWGKWEAHQHHWPGTHAHLTGGQCRHARGVATMSVVLVHGEACSWNNQCQAR